MKQIIIPLAAGIIVMLGACTKNDAVNRDETTATKPLAVQLQKAAADPAANPANPYDNIGLQHNIVLDTLRRFAKATGDTSRKGMNTFMSHYFEQHYGKPLPAFSYPYEQQLIKDYRTVLLTQNVSPAAKGFFRAFSDALQSIKDLDHYDAFKQQIVNTEGKILQAALPDRERTVLLMTASVLRYSGWYWMKAFKTGDVTYHPRDEVKYLDGWLRKIAGIITGIAADASVICFNMAWELYDPNTFGLAADMSYICGYGTGWY